MRRAEVWVVAAVALVAACDRSLEPIQSRPLLRYGDPGFTLMTSRGQEIRIRLGTAGPGEWDTAGMSSSAVRFLGVSLASTAPVGPLQDFRFLAVDTGRSILTFRHTDSKRVVSDTILVRW